VVVFPATRVGAKSLEGERGDEANDGGISGKGRVAGNEGEGADGVGSLGDEEEVVATGEVPGGDPGEIIARCRCTMGVVAGVEVRGRDGEVA